MWTGSGSTLKGEENVAVANTEYSLTGETFFSAILIR